MDVSLLGDLMGGGPSFEDLKNQRLMEMLRNQGGPAMPRSQPTPMPQAMPQPMPQPMAPPMVPPGPAQAAPGGLPRATGRAMPPQGPAAPPGPPMGPPEPPGGAAPGGPPGMPSPLTGDPLEDQYRRSLQQRQQLQAEAERASAMPDRSGMEEAFKRNQAQGSQGMLLALAAQEAGMSPISAHYLKKASESSAPMKMTGGTMTETGFIEDPAARQEADMRRVDAKIKQNETILQQAITEKERRSREEENRELKKMQIEATAEAARGRLAMTAATNAQSAANAAGVGQARQANIANGLRDDFAKWTEKPRLAQAEASSLLKTIPDLNNMNAQQQQATVFQFMRMLDPGSVVRESEYAMAQSARGLMDAMGNYKEQVLNGNKLTPTQVGNMQMVARAIIEAQDKVINQKAAEFHKMGDQYGVPDFMITPGYSKPGAKAPGAGGYGKPPPGAVTLVGG